MLVLLDTEEVSVATVLEAGAPPSVPTLQSPANGVTGVAIPVTMSWQPAAEASSYRLQLATDADFSQLVVDQSGILQTSRAVSGLSTFTQYLWRVNATNPMGTSDWSQTWSFTTGEAVADPISAMMPLVAMVMMMGMVQGMMPQEGI